MKETDMVCSVIHRTFALISFLEAVLYVGFSLFLNAPGSFQSWLRQLEHHDGWDVRGLVGIVLWGGFYFVVLKLGCIALLGKKARVLFWLSNHHPDSRAHDLREYVLAERVDLRADNESYQQSFKEQINNIYLQFCIS